MLDIRSRRIAVVAQGFLGESAHQPAYYVVIGVFVLLGAAAWAVFDSPLGMGSGPDLLLETAIGSLTLLGLVILLTIGTNVFHEEIRRRTIITLLSKPLNSAELVLGKFVGVAGLLLPAYGVVSLVFITGLRLMEAELPWMTLIAGLLLSYIQVLMLAAVGLALSVHLPLVATAGVVVTFFAAGNLIPYLRNRLEDSGPLVQGTLGAASVVVPNLNPFDLTRAASLGISVPISYLSWAFLYAALYGAAALLLAIWLMDRREVY